MPPMLDLRDVRKTYPNGTDALKGVSLQIKQGEILALLGPNGAGKTTLISIICGISTMTAGSVEVGGHDVVTDFRAARQLIGIVPQELSLDPFARVGNCLRLSRGLFGLPRSDSSIEGTLKKLSLWDRRNNRVHELSGGMKRRVLIGKALAHEPKVLFLDEPTAGVDVELRKDMWRTVRDLKEQGTTIILTTHYIEEAEAIADRVGVISNGEILLVEETEALMHRMGRKEMIIELQEPIDDIPESLSAYGLRRGRNARSLVYSYVSMAGKRPGITSLLTDISAAGFVLRDVQTRQSSLEDIFVDLLRDAA